MSKDGQTIIENNGYVSISNAAPYNHKSVSGKIVVSGSSSVTPIMEKLKEAYLEKNPDFYEEILAKVKETYMSNSTEITSDEDVDDED